VGELSIGTHTTSGRHYFAVTLAISWGGALPAIGGSGGMLGTTPSSDPRFAYALMASPAFLPGIVTSDQKASLVLVSLADGLAAGQFEELGWTGFAIPTLRRRASVLATGVIVGIWWSAWHLLPNIWASRAAAGELAMSVYLAGIAIGIFVGYLTAFRVLMVWVYDHTQSLVLGMLMHASFTASLLVLNPRGIAGAHLQTYSLALAGGLWVIVAAIAIRSGWRVGHQPRRSVRPAA
jgi:membrane protease YdiL (CAAX protease family)